MRLMVMAGISQDQIAQVMECSLATLKRHFQRILSTAREFANAQVAGALYKNAIKGNVSAQIFWLKAQAGWTEGFREARDAEHESKPVKIIIETQPRPNDLEVDILQQKRAATTPTH